jgi:CheY-like chemotaxis protein
MDAEAPKLVLIVEDNADQSNAMLTALKDAGFSPTGASGVRDAVFKLKNQRVSCIILDLLLGEERGIEVIDFIRTRKDCPNSDTPILVVSANLSKGALQSIAGKIQGAMVKPLAMAAFVANVQKLAK